MALCIKVWCAPAWFSLVPPYLFRHACMHSVPLCACCLQMKHFLTSLNAHVLHLASAHDCYLSAVDPFITLKVRQQQWQHQRLWQHHCNSSRGTSSSNSLSVGSSVHCQGTAGLRCAARLPLSGPRICTCRGVTCAAWASMLPGAVHEQVI